MYLELSGKPETERRVSWFSLPSAEQGINPGRNMPYRIDAHQNKPRTPRRFPHYNFDTLLLLVLATNLAVSSQHTAFSRETLVFWEAHLPRGTVDTEKGKGFIEVEWCEVYAKLG